MHEKVVAQTGERRFVGVRVMGVGKGGAGGRLTAADAAFAQVMGMVTQADGSQIAQSLTQLGITEIRLTEDATKITLTDGSMINGQSSFVMNGVTRTVASAVLMAETQGYRVVESVSLSGTDQVVYVWERAYFGRQVVNFGHRFRQSRKVASGMGKYFIFIGRTWANV